MTRRLRSSHPREVTSATEFNSYARMFQLKPITASTESCCTPTRDLVATSSESHQRTPRDSRSNAVTSPDSTHGSMPSSREETDTSSSRIPEWYFEHLNLYLAALKHND